MIEGDKAFIIELTIPYETSEAYLLSRMDDKRAKYQPLLNELEQVGCTSAEIIPIVVGSLGTITRDSKQILKQLKLRDQMDAIQMTTITGSINILNNHFRRNDFTRHKINKKNSKYKQLSTNNWRLKRLKIERRTQDWEEPMEPISEESLQSDRFTL